MKKLSFILATVLCILAVGVVTIARMTVISLDVSTPAAGGGCSGYYGNDTITGSYDSLGGRSKCIKITLDCSGTPSGARGYWDDLGGVTDEVEYALYDDDGGSGDAGTLLGLTNSSCGSCGNDPEWVEITSWVSGPGSLSAGDYWLCGGTEDTGRLMYQTGGSEPWDIDYVYTFGAPSDPFDSTPSSTDEYSALQLKF